MPACSVTAWPSTATTSIHCGKPCPGLPDGTVHSHLPTRGFVWTLSQDGAVEEVCKKAESEEEKQKSRQGGECSGRGDPGTVPEWRCEWKTTKVHSYWGSEMRAF